MNTAKKIVINKQAYRLLFTRQEILEKVTNLAEMIYYDYAKNRRPPIIMFVLTGGVYLGVDLSRSLDNFQLVHEIDNIGLKRYSGDESGGLIQLISPPTKQLGGRDLIVVEDIIDCGQTMNFLNSYLKNLDLRPSSINYCTLFLKHNHDPLSFDIKYLGYKIGPEWVIGNGMDANQHYRGLTDVYVKDAV